MPIGIYGPDEIESAFADMAKGGADARSRSGIAWTWRRSDRIVAQAATARGRAL